MMAVGAAVSAVTAAAAVTCLSLLNNRSSSKRRVACPYLSTSLKLSSSPLAYIRTQKHFFPLRQCSGPQDSVLDDTLERDAGAWGHQEEANRTKLYVVNLPWSYSASDLENLFGQCGTVDDVEIIKQRDGRNRGFAFVAMASPEEAQAAIEKLDSYELAGRIIKVQLAKSFNKPLTKTPSTPSMETKHKIYVGNLHWKARAGNLREFFSAKYNPVSARVVFDNPSGRSAGYGFVSFDTMEEVETAITELDGVELMGRPLRLRVSQKKDGESETKQDDSIQEHYSEP